MGEEDQSEQISCHTASHSTYEDIFEPRENASISFFGASGALQSNGSETQLGAAVTTVFLPGLPTYDECVTYPDLRQDCFGEPVIFKINGLYYIGYISRNGYQFIPALSFQDSSYGHAFNLIDGELLQNLKEFLDQRRMKEDSLKDLIECAVEQKRSLWSKTKDTCSLIHYFLNYLINGDRNSFAKVARYLGTESGWINTISVID